MKRMLAIFGILVFGLVTSGGPSSAQEFRHYPWCIFSGGSESSVEFCAFDSFAQCMLTQAGGGGICFANPLYRAIVEPPQQRARRRRS